MQPAKVREATLKTAVVEIKTLTLGGKQMTLSVFRQLPNRHIVGAGISLVGRPWGLVNYFWDGCGYRGHHHEHQHVVWECDGRLYRCCVGPLQREGEFVGSKLMPNRVITGDTVGLELIAPGRVTWNYRYNRGYQEVEVLTPDEFAEGLSLWNGLVAQLGALDQLFIAV
jgi:hypothetical protein